MPRTPEKTAEQILAEIRSQPGIDVSRLAKGTRLLIETTQYLYEFVVVDTVNRLVEIQGSDPRFKNPVIGQFLRSNYDMPGLVFLENWIGKSLRMQVRFRDSAISFPCAVSVRIEGDGYHFDVF